MTESTLRHVQLSRTGEFEYQAVNDRGGVLSFGEGQNADFTPVELLLVALGGCNAITIEALTKRAEPVHFSVDVTADKLAEPGGGSRLQNTQVTIDLRFANDEAGQKMAGRIDDAIEKSHTKYCTVSRSIEPGMPAEISRVGP